MALFDIIVPTYNNLSGLQSCLNSILSQSIQDFRVWVCVDGSTDGTLEFLETFCDKHQQFTYLIHPDRLNKGRAINRNQALPFLSSRFTLFIDGDVVCSAHLLASHYDILMDNPEFVSLGYTNWECQDNNNWAKYICGRGVAKHKHLEKVPYQYFTTQNVAMPTSYIIEEKGFDQYFKFYGGEDTEFAYRLFHNHKAKFVFNKNAVVSTKSDKDLGQALQLLEIFGKENLSYIAKKHPDCSQIFYLPLLKNNNFKSKIFRGILNAPIYQIAYKVGQFHLGQLSMVAISYCVAYRIKKGFLTGY